MELKDKTIVIIGAACGLSAEMAREIAQRGANLALIDLDKTELDETVDTCFAAGIKDKGYCVNVTDGKAVEDLFSVIRSDFGNVDGLLNNAGITSDGLLVKAQNGKVSKKMALADFNKVVAVDLVAVFLCGREAAVHMIEGDWRCDHQYLEHFTCRKCGADQLYCRQGRGCWDDCNLGQGTGALRYTRRRFAIRVWCSPFLRRYRTASPRPSLQAASGGRTKSCAPLCSFSKTTISRGASLKLTLACGFEARAPSQVKGGS